MLLQTYRHKALLAGWNYYLQDDADTGMSFAIYVLPANAGAAFHTGPREMAFLLLAGSGVWQWQGREIAYQRSSWIEENPCVWHVPAQHQIGIQANAATELAICSVHNEEFFPPRYYSPGDIGVEQRGLGILQDTSHRKVRLAFDRAAAPPPARLVLGEVVNFPGKWSSYPPHHHPQPELYYYRFAPEHGYGHGELGEEVFKIKHHDLLKITGGRDHSQVAAPGFHMYYLWAIRHLPGQPYTGFEFTPPYGDLWNGS